MHKPIAFLAALLLSVAAHAAPPTTESIEALFESMKMERLVDLSFVKADKMLQQALSDLYREEQLSPEQQRFLDTVQARFTTILREEMSWSKKRPLYVKIYQESYTQDEIDGLVAFYKSPVGATFVDKTPIVTQKCLTVTESLKVTAIEKIRAAVEQAVAEAKAPK